MRINRVAKLCEDPATRPDIAPIDMESFNFESWDAENKKFYEQYQHIKIARTNVLNCRYTFTPVYDIIFP